MSQFQVQDTVGEIVARHPALSKVFEESGVDYCCGGKKTLQEVCRDKSFDPQWFVGRLEESLAATAGDRTVNVSGMSLSELVEHILATHHAYLREELLRLNMLTEKVAAVHGAHDNRLVQVRQTFVAMAAELASHIVKEEQILFPLIRQFDTNGTLPESPNGPIADSIREMESEHDEVGAALERFRSLTDEYTPPDWACNTYRAMIDALARFERDMHQHVHKENNVLFPSAVKKEAELAQKGRA